MNKQYVFSNISGDMANDIVVRIFEYRLNLLKKEQSQKLEDFFKNTAIDSNSEWVKQVENLIQEFGDKMKKTSLW